MFNESIISVLLAGIIKLTSGGAGEKVLVSHRRSASKMSPPPPDLYTCIFNELWSPKYWDWFVILQPRIIVDPEFAKVSYLRDFQTIDISTIGDAETKMIVVEYGLEVSNEAAHGVVADLTTS